jgi:hypothetical protein
MHQLKNIKKTDWRKGMGTAVANVKNRDGKLASRCLFFHFLCVFVFFTDGMATF